MRPLILAVLLLTACAPTLDPVGGEGYYSAINTETVKVQATQVAAIPITQSYAQQEYDRHATETAIPPALTRLANDNQATAIANEVNARNATVEALRGAYSITATVVALEILESEAQKTIAQNNAAIARSIITTNVIQDVLTWCSAIAVFLFGVLCLWGVIQLGLYLHNRRIIKQTGDKWREIFKAEREMLAAGVAPTSAGPTSYAVTVAERHVTEYAKRTSRDDQWRAALKSYVYMGVDLGRRGIDYPFSRANACRYLLITHPNTGRWWQLGHDRIVKLGREVGVFESTGKGGETVLIVDVEEVARKIDLSPLPELSPDPVPAVKITLAGMQVSQVSRLAGV